jgi:MFS transporter, UMF1 family
MAAQVTAAAGSPPLAATPRRIERRSIASWVVYDLANTAFSLGVVTLYFPGIVGDVFGLDTDASIGGLDAIAAAVILVAAPILGAVSDQAARRLPFLALFTLACVTATFFMGQSVPAISFVLFVVAAVCYQAGLIFYDSLLPEVSTDENRGRIGGIGVGVGYLGSLLAIGIGTVILGGGSRGSLDEYTWIFRAIALAFLLLALPTFLFVRERPRVVPPLSWRVAPRAFAEVASTARHARRYPGLGSFLLGRMFYADAANTLIFMVIVFAETSLHMTKSQATPVAILTILFAIPAGLCWGFVVDRIGPRRTLDVVLVAWMGIFAVVAAIPVLGLPSGLIYPVGAMVGIALAGLWASDRPLMARLAPPRYYGQFFGLYAMVGRFGAVVGPTVWALVAGKAFLDWGQPAAVVFLLIWVVIAFLLLRRVDDTPRAWAPEDLPELVADAGS